MKKSDGLGLASTFMQHLLRQEYPVQRVYLFGSFAQGTPHEGSDIDVAVVCSPFLPSKDDEDLEFRKARWGIDLRIEPVFGHQLGGWPPHRPTDTILPFRARGARTQLTCR